MNHYRNYKVSGQKLRAKDSSIYFFGDTVHQAKVNNAIERSAYVKDPRDGSGIPMVKKIRKLEKKVPTQVLRKYERLMDKENFERLTMETQRFCCSSKSLSRLIKAQELQAAIVEAINHDRRMLANCY